MVIELRVVQFWCEIKLVITNHTPATRSCDFVIARLISHQIALHSVQLPLLMRLINTYRPLKRISPLVWIDAGRPLDEKEISAVTLPVTIDHPASENMLENTS